MEQPEVIDLTLDSDSESLESAKSSSYSVSSALDNSSESSALESDSESSASKPSKKSVEYYHGNRCLPVYEHPRKGYTGEEIVKILLNPTFRRDFICSTHPISVQNNVSFVVDLSKLEDPNDIRADDLGAWKCTGSRILRFTVKIDNCKCSIVNEMSQNATVVHVRRQYHVHATDPDLHRMIAFLECDKNDKSDSNVTSRCIIQYWFESGREHKVLIRSHGNAKKRKQSFCRTHPSTIKALKEEAQNCPPKEALSAIYDEKGGVMGAKCLGELPRNRDQVSNMRRSITSKLSMCSSKGLRDPLFMVMEQCKLCESGDKFVRIVTASPEPMCLLATDQQLNDLIHFATNPNKFCVISIDPTFSLGDFSVTCIAYRNLLVIDTRTGESPIMLGPMLVHQRKLFTTYHFFASSLVGISPKLANILAFGTDGEEAVVKAFKQQFPFAVHLRCFRHMKQDIQRKLSIDMGFSTDSVSAIIASIFGQKDGPTFFEGLVDANSEVEFDSQLKFLEKKWGEIEANPESKISFYEWFKRYHAEEVKSTMIRSVREAAGLGYPPSEFCTNDSEAINSALKQFLLFKKSDWPIYNEKMKKFVLNQQEEICKAIIGLGQYSLREEYQHFSIEPSHWFTAMNDNQRKDARKALQQATVDDKQEVIIHSDPNNQLHSTSMDDDEELSSVASSITNLTSDFRVVHDEFHFDESLGTLQDSLMDSNDMPVTGGELQTSHQGGEQTSCQRGDETSCQGGDEELRTSCRRGERVSCRGEQTSLQGGEQRSHRGNEKTSLQGGQQISCRGGEKTSLQGSQQTSRRGGEKTSLQGGQQTSRRGGEQASCRRDKFQTCRGGEQASRRGGEQTSCRRDEEFETCRGGEQTSCQGGEQTSHRRDDETSRQGGGDELQTSCRRGEQVSCRGEQRSHQGNEKTSLQGGQQISHRRGEKTSLQGSQQTSHRGGEKMSLQGGQQTSRRGGEKMSLQGGQQTSLQGGELTSLQGGQQTSLQEGQQTSRRGDEQASCRRDDEFQTCRGGEQTSRRRDEEFETCRGGEQTSRRGEQTSCRRDDEFQTCRGGEQTSRRRGDDELLTNVPKILSVDVIKASEITRLPTLIVRQMWSKAADLLASKHVTPAPGCSNMACMVASSSQPKPHFVSFTNDRRFECDESCPAFLQRFICSHCVAAAENNGLLHSFLENYAKYAKTPKGAVSVAPNYTRLSMVNLPCGVAGRKGGKAPKKKRIARRKTVPSEQRQPLNWSMSDKTTSSTGQVSRSPSGLTIVNTSAGNTIVNTSAGNWNWKLNEIPSCATALCFPSSFPPSFLPSLPPSFLPSLPPNFSSSYPSSFYLPSPSYHPPLTDVSNYQYPFGASTSETGSSSWKKPPLSDVSNYQYPFGASTSETGSPSWKKPPLSDVSNCHYSFGASMSETGSPPWKKPPLTDASNYHYSFGASTSETGSSFLKKPEPFLIKLLNGRIKVCAGCKGSHPKNANNGLLPPPYNICVGHSEPITFINSNTGMECSKIGNAYYHISLTCIRKKYPNFIPSELVCTNEVKVLLEPVHFQYLWDTLGFSVES